MGVQESIESANAASRMVAGMDRNDEDRDDLGISDRRAQLSAMRTREELAAHSVLLADSLATLNSCRTVLIVIAIELVILIILR